MHSLPAISDRENATLRYISVVSEEIKPVAGIILGTGLGGLVKDLDIIHKIDYHNIPYFPISTVESHHGYLIYAKLSGRYVIVMQGRFHYYEGYSHQQITYPVYIMKRLGVRYLIVSNACGGLNPLYKKSDLMIMKDHINFHFHNPFKKPVKKSNIPVYDSKLIALAEKTAVRLHIPVRKGVYLSLHGPCLETAAEYRMIRKFGADVVGMSTIPEAIAASYLGIKVLGLSIITDMGLPDTLKPAVLEEILEAAAIAEPKLTLLTKEIVKNL